MPESEKLYKSVTADEERDIARSLLLWLNTVPDKPVSKIEFEFLPKDRPGMSLTAIQAAYKTREYILGGYEAQYQFGILYRVQSDDDDSRLSADEELNRIAGWMERNQRGLALDGAVLRSIVRNSTAATIAVYEDGSRDHQILMTLTYEVI